MSAELFVERIEQGGYAVKRPGSTAPSAVAPSKPQAIEAAFKLDPTATVYVERFHDIHYGGRDKWRKVSE